VATAAVAVAAQQEEPQYAVGVLAGLEYSPTENADLTDEEKRALKDLCTRAAKRDYPARLIEVIQAWEAALFYRGFQFLIPQRGGGWLIPGESTGYGPSMQLDLALLPTNIYSSYGQILISALTRSVPGVRFEPQEANNDAQITAAESAGKFVKVIKRNNDLIMVQTDAARYLYNDGRAIYWSRFVKDGQRFGWKEDQEPTDIIPETEPPESQAQAIEAQEQQAEQPPTETPTDVAQAESASEGSGQGDVGPAALAGRTPLGQEVRTAHGKLEFKLIPMSANCLDDCDAAQYETEVDEARAKGMFPEIADDIKAGSNGVTEGEIARLARLNVKLGMQSTYITSDSIAEDVTLQRTWMRPGYLMKIKNKTVRDSLITKFPDGVLVCYAGETFCYARNESMDDSLALIQAYSGDGQNRNAMGTSMMPVQKRINNWLDLMNDYFVRTVPKKWMDNKAFNVQAAREQTNVPGDIGQFKSQPNKSVNDLIFVEPQVSPPATLADFVKQYIGPLSELLTGAYPALSGGDTGSNDTARGISIQRDQALGRLGPTWHSLVNGEATSMRQLVRWGAKCRDEGTINERIPGGETISLEVNNLKANILCFPDTDENIPETFTQKQNRLMQFMTETAKNPFLQEVLFNAANLEFLQSMVALPELYIPQVASRNKQLGEIELLLKDKPVPNPKILQGQKAVMGMQAQGVDPMMLMQAKQQLRQLELTQPEISSIEIDEQVDDSQTEAETCWQFMNNPEGRKIKKVNRDGFENVRLHFLAHAAAAAKKAAGNMNKKPPSQSINLKDLVGSERGQMLQEVGIVADDKAEAANQAI
jgi:hypothetical protein